MKEKEKNPEKYLHDLSFLESTKKLKKIVFIFCMHHRLNNKFIRPMKT